MNIWLIIYGFMSRYSNFHLYGDVTITGERLQNLVLCSVLRIFEQGDIFIVPHLLWHGTSVFLVSFEGPPHSVFSYHTQGDVEDISNIDPHESHSVTSYDMQGDAEDLAILTWILKGLKYSNVHWHP
jgi:hypothetical protein